MTSGADFVVHELISERLLTPEQLEQARQEASSSGCSVEQALVQMGVVSERRVALTRAWVSEYPYIDLATVEPDLSMASLLPRSLAERVRAFPLFVGDRVATVAVADALDLSALDQVRRALGLEIDPVVAEATALRTLIERSYSIASTRGEVEEEEPEKRDAQAVDEGPIVAAVREIIASAVDAGASDIHVSPDESSLQLRFRVDGVLRAQQGPGLSAHAGLIQRLKVLAGLDVTETRRPQDGKFRFSHRGRSVDVRLSLLPTIYGENAVLRLLRPAGAIGSLADLGMPADLQGRFEHLISHPHGMILATGPTGSGKTTTLYTALAAIATPDRNIMTIEDPVEIRLPGIRQTQARSDLGLGFATALRSILRQDPDVVLVGEIRDEETARIASQAALTGHLVFSTLHTNDAPGAVGRLLDLGVPAFAVVNGLLGVLAQRLLRRLCEQCRTPEEDTALLASVGLANFRGPVFAAHGCGSCMGTGYKGRVGVYELLAMDAGVRAAVLAGEPSTALAAASQSYEPMQRDGHAKVLRGKTSITEMLRLRAFGDEDIAPAEAA